MCFCTNQKWNFLTFSMKMSKIFWKIFTLAHFLFILFILDNIFYIFACVSFVKFELVCVCWVDSFVFSIFSMKSNVSSYFCFMFLNKITLALLSCLLMLYLPLSTLFMSHLCSCTHISISLHSESPYS